MLFLFALLFTKNVHAGVPASLYPVIHQASKKTVCTMTINSDEEKNEFLKKLSPSKFEFFELVPELGSSKNESIPKDWFSNVCAQKISCDLLVISGHFGGTFFGSSGARLSLEALERASCSNQCRGIINHPSEVFLFGCNTLAEKNPPGRTAEESLAVWLADGIPYDQAIQMVESVYGDFGMENRERMRRVFWGVPRIYGFKSLGPSGRSVKEMLSSYLEKIGDYSSHLDEVRMHSDRENTILSTTLKKTAFAQCSGLNPNDPRYPESQLLCRLFDSTKSLDERAKIALKLYRSPRKMQLVGQLADFIEQNREEYSLSMVVFQYEIQNDLAAKKLVEDALGRLTSPGLMEYWIGIASRIGWLTPQRREYHYQKLYAALFKLPMTRERIDQIHSLSQGDDDERRLYQTRALKQITAAHLRDSFWESYSMSFEWGRVEFIPFAKEILSNSSRETQIAMINALNVVGQSIARWPSQEQGFFIEKAVQLTDSPNFRIAIKAEIILLAQEKSRAHAIDRARRVIELLPKKLTSLSSDDLLMIARFLGAAEKRIPIELLSERLVPWEQELKARGVDPYGNDELSSVSYYLLRFLGKQI